MKHETGWKPIPLSLKIIFVLTCLWMIGSLFAIPVRFESGLPFFGLFITGIVAAIILLLLDLVGPLFFLIGLWKRKKYGFSIAVLYISIFVLNSIVALFTVGDQLGYIPIMIPALVYVVFLVFIVKNKPYFN